MGNVSVLLIFKLFLFFKLGVKESKSNSDIPNSITWARHKKFWSCQSRTNCSFKERPFLGFVPAHQLSFNWCNRSTRQLPFHLRTYRISLTHQACTLPYQYAISSSTGQFRDLLFILKYFWKIVTFLSMQNLSTEMGSANRLSTALHLLNFKFWKSFSFLLRML